MAVVKLATAIKKLANTGLYMWPSSNKTYLYTINNGVVIRNLIENGSLMRVKNMGLVDDFIANTDLGDKWNVSKEDLNSLIVIPE